MTTFAELGLSQPVLQALDMKGYTVPTPIQEQAIPPVLKGRDSPRSAKVVMVNSQNMRRAAE